MKRFRWPLQRLLDVTVQRERAARAKLFRLSQEIAAAHREIFRLQASLRSALDELADLEMEKRLIAQEVFMRYAEAEEAKLDLMREKLKALQERQSENLTEFKKAKSSRETLERLRDEALRRHTRETLKAEQKQLDESSQAAFARELIKQTGR